jgi:hypothetical protein
MNPVCSIEYLNMGKAKFDTSSTTLVGRREPEVVLGYGLTGFAGETKRGAGPQITDCLCPVRILACFGCSCALLLSPGHLTEKHQPEHVSDHSYGSTMHRRENSIVSCAMFLAKRRIAT